MFKAQHDTCKTRNNEHLTCTVYEAVQGFYSQFINIAVACQAKTERFVSNKITIVSL